MAYDIFNDPSMAPGIQGVKVSAQIAQGGISRILTRTYKVDEELTTSFYSGIGQELKSNDIPIGYGRVMLTGTLVDSGIMRSDLDPDKIKKVVQFVTTEGPTKGIVGVDASKLQSVYVGGKKVTTSDTGQQQDIGLKEILGGVAASAAVMKGVDYVKEMLGFDTETGAALPDKIQSIFGPDGKLATDALTGGDEPKDGDIYAYDPKTKGFKARPFVEVHKESGIEIDDIVVKHNGEIVRSDTMTFNFIGSGITITDVAGQGKQVNIQIEGGGEPGGTPTPAPACSVNIVVDCEPVDSARYFLKRNGKVVSAMLIGSSKHKATDFKSKASVASHLINNTTPPDAIKAHKLSVASDGNKITITGDATCGPCDIGSWTLECWAPVSSGKHESMSSSAEDPCAPRKPTLTV